MILDLNCDLGEGEPPARTWALMRCVTSINVACGGHAGDVETMTRCVRLARRYGVKLGAHPGHWGRADFGRTDRPMTTQDLETLLRQQVGALTQVAAAQGVPLHHIKLHGTLYHASERDRSLGRAYVAAVKQWWPKAILYCRAGGELAQWGRALTLRVWEEVFVDRGYRDDGMLVARGQPEAVLADPQAARARVQALLETGTVRSVGGRDLRLRPRTLCLHSDTPLAVRIARAVAQALAGAKRSR